MRFLDALAGRPVDTTPVWLMRQAGRYLPEYRALRERASFLELCRNPELAAEATLQPMRRFDLDAAITFSDILVVPEAMWCPVSFDPHPVLSRPVRTAADVSALAVADPHRDLGFVLDATRRIRQALDPDRALIGFAGGPFTLASYLVEGGGSRDLLATKTLMMREPSVFDELLGRIGDSVAPFLAAQAEAGADAVQVFDTWAGMLSPADYDRFALPAARSVIRRVREAGVPVVYFVLGSAGMLRSVASAGADCVGIDFHTDLAEAVQCLGPDSVIQGNLDPARLFGPEADLREEAASIVAAGRAARGHVFNLGHGVLPGTPVETVAALVDAVHRAGAIRCEPE